MSDYKVGDKFLIEIGEVFTGDMSIRNHVEKRYAIKGFNSLVFDANGLDRLERLDSDYINENFGELQDEAYEAGRKAGQEEAIKWSCKNETDMYNAGLNDAWELARKIINENLTFADAKNCFGIDINGKSGFTIAKEIFSIPYKEVLAKLEVFEKTQNEIKVGDIVTVYPNKEILVTRVAEDKSTIEGFGTGGFGHTYCYMTCKKTGKHIDIQSILNQIGGESE